MVKVVRRVVPKEQILRLLAIGYPVAKLEQSPMQHTKLRIIIKTRKEHKHMAQNRTYTIYFCT